MPQWFENRRRRSPQRPLTPPMNETSKCQNRRCRPGSGPPRETRMAFRRALSWTSASSRSTCTRTPTGTRARRSGEAVCDSCRLPWAAYRSLLTYASPVPSTVAHVFAAAGVKPAGVVAWGISAGPPTQVGAVATGIYVVALTDKLDDLDAVLPTAPISPAAVDELLDARPELTLDQARPTREQLAARLAAFWFPDEVVVYIGLAGSRRHRPPQGEVAHRVAEYYKTRVGARSPHGGGWPLKTLACLSDLFVHYGYCSDVDASETAAIGYFAENVSEATLEGLHDRIRVMPFANLEFPKGNAKNHGMRGAREPRKPEASKGSAIATPDDVATR